MDFDSKTIERYRLKLRYKVCYHLGSLCPDVDDVVQETLARLLRAHRDDKIRNPESTAAFVSGICNNVIREYRRRLWREPVSETDLDSLEHSQEPEAELLGLRQDILAAMAQLSNRDRNILNAFFLQERDKDEICRSMGLTDTQFRVALFRAKKRFRKIYQQKLKQEASRNH